MKTAEFYRGISLPEEAIELLEKVKDTDEKEMKELFQNNREVFYKLVDYLEKCLIYRHIRRFAD